jgi:hypothetical protein
MPVIPVGAATGPCAGEVVAAGDDTFTVLAIFALIESTMYMPPTDRSSASVIDLSALFS